MGKLLLVPTPIGNMADISIRALEALRNADLVLCEDTRHTRKLFSHHEVSTPLRAFHMHNEHAVLDQSIELIRNSESICLVSDAGTPGISDPGYLLVRECLNNDIEIECLPGPSALLPALVVSGFPCERFCFEGFLPHKKGRQTRLKELQEEKRTMVFYESPHRLLKSLKQFVEYFGEERKISVSRELTKIHEEHLRGTASELITHFEEHKPRGEFVVIVEGLR